MNFKRVDTASSSSSNEPSKTNWGNITFIFIALCNAWFVVSTTYREVVIEYQHKQDMHSIKSQLAEIFNNTTKTDTYTDTCICGTERITSYPDKANPHNPPHIYDPTKPKDTLIIKNVPGRALHFRVVSLPGHHDTIDFKTNHLKNTGSRVTSFKGHPGKVSLKTWKMITEPTTLTSICTQPLDMWGEAIKDSGWMDYKNYTHDSIDAIRLLQWPRVKVSFADYMEHQKDSVWRDTTIFNFILERFRINGPIHILPNWNESPGYSH